MSIRMMRRILPLLLVGGLAIPQAAHACHYTQVPEAVGPASQGFFTQRMAAAATTVDVALAGTTRPAFGSDARWRIPATTFHVIDRIKGHSPDRYTLFVGASGADDRDVEAQHWVDANGRVTPFPYPVENEPMSGTTRSMTSCHPGFLAVRKGEAYLVFRDADGRLLGQFALYDDLMTAAFPLVRAGLGTREGWLAWAGPPQSERSSNGSVVATNRATVRFGRPISARAAEGWLRRAGLVPFAVRVAAGPVLDEARVPSILATAGLVDRALNDARSNDASDALATLAARMQQGITAETLDNDALIRSHVWLVAEAAGRLRIEPDEPLVVSMDVTGPAAALARLRIDPQGVEVIDGLLVNRGLHIGISADDTAQAQADAYRRETAASLLARLAAVARGRPLPDPVMKPPEPEPDPFAFGDCIRFGREEAAALAHLPEREHLDELAVFAHPEAATCTVNGGELACDLAPNTSVRISWAGWEGGFRISSRGARLTFDGSALQCPGG
jgi:hypothetical protein